MQLEANEQITPHEVCQAAVTLLGLHDAWNVANPEERKISCQILLQDVVFDFVKQRLYPFARSQSISVFQMVTFLQAIGDGSYVFHFG